MERSELHVRAWWRVTQALGGATLPDEVIRVVVHEGVRAMGADAGSVMLVSAHGEELVIQGSVGYDPDLVDLWRHLPLSRHTPATVAFTRCTPVLVETTQQALHDYPVLAPVLRASTGSLAALPLLVADRVLGVLTLSFAQPRVFDATDRTFLLSLAAQCAQALQRSAALREAEVQGTQLSFLAEASAVLGRSLDLTTTLDSIAGLTVPRLTDWCVIHLPGPEGRLSPVTVVHQDPAMVSFLRQFTERYPSFVDDDSSVARVFRSGQAEVVPEITDAMYDVIPMPEVWKDDVRRLQLRSVITVPMLAGGVVVGVLGMARTSLERAYTQGDLAFAQEVAARAGNAVEHAQLYQQLQRELAQRERAQQALDAANAHLEERVQERTRELAEVNEELRAFTYSASHDLRTPARHISSFAEILERRWDSTDERSREALEQIQQAARRMHAIIDGLLSLSRSSQLALKPVPVALGALVQGAIGALALETQGRSVEWRVSALPDVSGDAGLLALAVQNLLSNAVKYTQREPHAVIEVFAERRGNELIVSVRDNGVGFDPAYAHKLFQPFQRLHHPAEFEGTGIGLATARRIISRHGGRLWAQSTLDRGATFSFSLPLQP